jgi:ribosome-binding protein aMBF1 (putative translation factor)
MLLDPSTSSSGSEPDYVAPFVDSARARQVNIRFGERLQGLRLQRGLTDQELATRMVMPVDHLIDLESGRRSASIVDLEGFSQAFKISISELLQGL